MQRVPRSDASICRAQRRASPPVPIGTTRRGAGCASRRSHRTGSSLDRFELRGRAGPCGRGRARRADDRRRRSSRHGDGGGSLGRRPRGSAWYSPADGDERQLLGGDPAHELGASPTPLGDSLGPKPGDAVCPACDCATNRSHSLQGWAPNVSRSTWVGMGSRPTTASERCSLHGRLSKPRRIQTHDLGAPDRDQLIDGVH